MTLVDSIKTKQVKNNFYNKKIIKNNKYASILKNFANKGSSIFYKSPLSTNIINSVNKKKWSTYTKRF